jgi:hypothetical protein
MFLVGIPVSKVKDRSLFREVYVNESKGIAKVYPVIQDISDFELC